METKIPPQLSKGRFIKTLPDKRPMEKDWQASANYAADDPGFIQFIRENNRYGVLCGINNLVVVDFDNRAVYEEVRATGILPPTFTIRSAGKGLPHLYFYTDIPTSWKVLDENKETIVDIQGIGKQVIGPGSYNPATNRYYEIIDDTPIATIHMAVIHQVLDKYDPRNQIQPQPKRKPTSNRMDRSIIDRVKGSIRVSDILRAEGIDTRKNPTECPFHNSKGGKCFSFNDIDNIWHCFHCEEAGDVLRLYMMIHGMEFMEAVRAIANDRGIIIPEKPEIVQARVEKLHPDADAEEIDDILASTVKLSPIVQEKVLKGIAKQTGTSITPLRKQLKQIETTILAQENDPIETVVEVINNDLQPFKFVEYRDDNGLFVRKLDGCLYERDVKGKLEVLIDTVLDQIDPALSRDARRQEIIKKVRLKNFVSHKDYEPNRNIIIFTNGIYHLDTWYFTPFTGNEDGISFTWIPHDYHPLSPEIPLFDAFLQEILVSDEQIQCWWEWMGYCLTKRVGFKKAAIFHGPIDSGKTTLSKIMKHVIGKQNQAGTSFHRVFEDRFANSTLMDRQWNYDDDIGKQPIKDTANFKRLVGFEDMDVEIKGKTSFLYHNIIKIQGCCNNIPYIPETDVIGPKLLILRFPNQFPKQEGFVEQFLTPEITAYIITRSLYELRDRVERGHFTGMTDQDAITYLRKETDAVYGFINDCCVLGVDAGKSTEQGDVFSAFLEWADLFGKDVGYITNKKNENESKKVFTRKVHALGFNTSRPGSGDTRVRVYAGVQLKQDWKDTINESRFDVDEIQLTSNSATKQARDREAALESKETMAAIIEQHQFDTVKDAVMLIDDVETLSDREIVERLSIDMQNNEIYRILVIMRANGDLDTSGKK